MGSTSNIDVGTVLQLKNKGYTNTHIADVLQTSEASVRRALKRHNKEYSYHVDPRKYKFPVDEPFRIGEFFLGDDFANVAVTADWHIPLTDFEFVNTFLTTAKNFKCTKLIIAGDFLNGDTYSNYFPKQENAGVDTEVRVAIEIMGKLLDNFEEVYFLKGNHDYRYVKQRNYEISFADRMYEIFAPLGDKLDRLHISNLDHCIVYSPLDYWSTDKWYVCHPKAYSSVPGTVARKLTTIHQCNVITGHSHHCADMYGPNGIHRAVEIGGFMDMSKTQYVQETTTFPRWQMGFGIMSREYGFTLFHGKDKSDTKWQLSGLASGQSRQY
jgi:predicted phosphodiesterase